MNSKRWKVICCNSGESCWCRLIVPEDSDGKDDWIIPSGALHKDDANLVAAAPELLETLLKCKCFILSNYSSNSGAEHELLEEVELAIKKATNGI